MERGYSVKVSMAHLNCSIYKSVAFVFITKT
jgi:hypothetical protein